MARLKNVESWMRWFGWTDFGRPGSVKHDADGKVVAHHGDNVWNSDVALSCIKDEQDRRNDEIMDEIEAMDRQCP